MLHVFSTNRVKLVARTPTTTIKKGQREYAGTVGYLLVDLRMILWKNHLKCWIYTQGTKKSFQLGQ